MQTFKVFTLLISILFSFNSFASDSPFKTVQEFFAATSAVDHSRLRSLATEDFQLLEVGDIWDIDKLVSVIQPSDEKRLNYFNLITTKVNGDIAWVSYWNQAKFVKGDESFKMAWLESAVLVKENSKWRIQMLHSTRIKKDKFPKNIVMTEFTE
ncbi:nuclear transport factor 2 family protein [Colwellia sp. 75C3]|uniref:nuclear transport factor 2 family protein n=1 Tax=Colwellia sp. 75C3 TaxID=888425 RepID=UPI000C3425D9|nr:nuclear transport factor 2 family protein [Colwellia sp. 75C3]PKG80911.1 nuclear transport factor 2 family protein [Colwellia sp. 75C3]